MSKFTLDQVPMQWRISNIGVHNWRIYNCPECNIHWPDFGQTAEFKVGFGEMNGEVVIVSECPACSARTYFHASISNLVFFLAQ